MTDADNAIDAATRAVLIADTSDDQAARAHALHTLALALEGGDRLDESVLIHHLAARAAQAAGAHDLAQQATDAGSELRRSLSQGRRYEDRLFALDAVLRAHDHDAANFALTGSRTDSSPRRSAASPVSGGAERVFVHGPIPTRAASVRGRFPQGTDTCRRRRAREAKT